MTDADGQTDLWKKLEEEDCADGRINVCELLQHHIAYTKVFFFLFFLRGNESVTTPSPSHFVRITTVDLVKVGDPYSNCTDRCPAYFAHIPAARC